MSRESDIEFTQMRRRDRAVEDRSWIHHMLLHAPIGTLATVGPDGPNLNPNLFVFEPDAEAVYIHTARTGQSRLNAERDTRVAFSVSEMGNLLPADSAVEYSVEYASVILGGRVSIVEDPVEARRVLMLLMRKYAPQFEPERDYREISDHDLSRTTVFRIDIERWSGKGKGVEAPDAYSYREVDRRDQSKDKGSSGWSQFTAAVSDSFGQAFWGALRGRTESDP